MTERKKIVLGVVITCAIIGGIAMAAIFAGGVAMVAASPQFQQEVQHEVQQAKDVAEVSANPQVKWMMSDPIYLAWTADQVKQMTAAGLDEYAQASEIKTRSMNLWKGIFRLNNRDIRQRVSLVCAMATATEDASVCADIAATNYSQQGKHFDLLNDAQKQEWVALLKKIIHSEIADDPDPIEETDDVLRNFVSNYVPAEDTARIVASATGGPSEKCWFLRYMCSGALALPRSQSADILRWMATQ